MRSVNMPLGAVEGDVADLATARRGGIDPLPVTEVEDLAADLADGFRLDDAAPAVHIRVGFR